MKKLIILAILAILAFPISAMCDTRTATATWSQPAASLPNLASWKVYTSPTAGGPYTLLATMPYDGTARPTYTTTGTLTQAAGTIKNWYFIVRAVGKNGSESPNSNEVMVPLDLSVMDAPVTLTITISTN
jgi:hypothetical protein